MHPKNSAAAVAGGWHCCGDTPRCHRGWGGGWCHPPAPAGREPREKGGKKAVENGGKSWKRRCFFFFLARSWARGSARGAGPLPTLGASLSHPRSPPRVPPPSPRPALSHQPVWPPPSGAFQSLPSSDCPFWGHPRAGGDTPRWHRAEPARPEPPPEVPPPVPLRGSGLSPGCDNPGGVTPRVSPPRSPLSPQGPLPVF